MTEKDGNVQELCNSLQNDEIEVLESIYPSLLSVQPTASGRPGKLLELTIPITFPSSQTVNMNPMQSASSSSTSTRDYGTILELLHLPPLCVRLLLPASYPLVDPPKPLGLQAVIPNDESKHSWLSRTTLRKMQDKILDMWGEERQVMGEGSGIIWKWWEWVGTGEFFRDLGMSSNGSIQLSIPPLIALSTFHTTLKTYNGAQLNSSFESSAFSCSICFDTRKGKSCIQMPDCGCVFCHPCLSSCWTLAIEEGTLENVTCPSVDCVKRRAKSTLAENVGTDSQLVESVVGSDLCERWQKLEEKRKIETDPSYTLCPRPSCQAAVPPPPLPTAQGLAALAANSSRAIRLADISKPKAVISAPPVPAAAAEGEVASGKEADDRWARYRNCPSCDYSFCLYCSSTWHGPHTPCAFTGTSALVLEYLSYPEGSEQRAMMEARRGRANLERMVAQWREDQDNRKWLESKTRPCAGCGVRVEKDHGCNHITCGRCNAHFCYRCGESISPQDPYAHYRTPGKACFEKLFDLEEIQRFEREAAGGDPEVLAFEDFGDWAPPRDIWQW